MRAILDKVKTTVEVLGRHAHIHAASIDNIEYVPCGYKENDTPPTEGWVPYEKGTRVAGHDAHFWFHMSFTTPACEEGRRVQLASATAFNGQGDTLKPQCMVFLNGTLTQALDTNHTTVRLEPETDYDVYIYYYMGMIHESTEVRFWLEFLDQRVQDLFYDMFVPMQACDITHWNSYEHVYMLKALEQASNLLELNYPYTPDYYARVEAARAHLKAELYDKLCGKHPAIVNCIGHTHIDVAWMWTLAQTREKVQRSFATALELMKHYPEYKFTMSQPQLFKFISENDPKMYEEIKERVKEGRWEMEGAMWLEADCNLISGESMVRQILHGKRFLKEEFDVDSRILFLPDVFGYSAAMPQILKKSGVGHFVTSKISWNDTNILPYDTFMWQGIDGTEIITDFITARNHHGDLGVHNPTTYVGLANASQIAGSWERYQQKAYNNEVMTTYGWGDGGGGPTEDMLEQLRRLSYGLPGVPRARISSLAEHLAHVEENFARGCEEIGRTPKWVGELYLEFHRGTYTSIGKNKRYNRKSEFLLQKTEASETMAGALLGKDYGKSDLYGLWDIVLLNQFHDIIPGSSIKEVYDVSWEQYEGVRAKATAMHDANLAALAAEVKSDGGVLVYNSLGFARPGTVTLDGTCYEVEEIPAYGWKVVKPENKPSRVTVQNLTAENDFFALELDEAGRIVKLIDKTNDRRVFFENAPAGEIQISEDMPRCYDNWELAEYYKMKTKILDDKADITVIDEGARKGFKICRTYHESTIEQRLYLYDTLPRIDVENVVNWVGHQQVMKIAFPTDINTSKATYEIQFGHVERPTHQNTSWDEAKFEVCGHKWMDLSDYNYGVSILNDCKYGFNVEGNVMKLTVLKCGVWPNDQADQGEHVFSYSIYPHAGDFRTGRTVQQAYDFNQPVDAVPVQANNDGVLAAEFSFVSTDCENVIIDTIKQCEDSDDVIVRVYDAYNCKSAPTLKFGVPVKAVAVADMMENAQYDLAVNDNTVKLPLANFEITTLKVTLDK